MKKYILGDCMDHLVNYKDNHFDLAIVDPPYGVDLAKKGSNSKEWGHGKKGFLFIKKKYKSKNWDNKPPANLYFQELKRVSKNQIIWGANFFCKYIGNMKNYIIWFKMGRSKNPKYSDTEFAFCSKNGVPKMIDIWWNGFGSINSGEKRIHPTQKPVALYRWILQNYAKPNDLILDTHVGSASSLIACHMEGFDYVGFEKDEDYFRDSTKRLQQHLSQIRMF